MAHWGSAKTLFGNPFTWPLSGKALPDGWAAVQKAQAAHAKTEREGGVRCICRRHLHPAGLWEKSIETNRRSAATSKNHFDSLHAMDYLECAYLQGAQDREAKRVLEEIAAIKKVDREHFVTAYALAAIPARSALERGSWADAARLSPHPNERGFPWRSFPQSMATLVYLCALGAARSGNAAAVREEIERLQRLRAAMIEAKIGYWVQQADIQIKVALAWAAFAAGNKQEALKLMREGADMEDASDKHPVTPGHVLPARELLGEMLLKLKQPELALQQFEASHNLERNRFRGLYGAAQAAELLGDTDKARTYYRKLVEISAKATQRDQSCRRLRRFSRRSNAI